ncbi:MAG: alpha/beta fold hydrolase [Myxococcales bacterium]|nr:MAG: alpha/beta fold hydrolase [Myxococcales bacterium]
MLDHFQRRQPDWLDRQQFPFRSRWLDTSQGTLHHLDEGPEDGQVVLLVHGTPSWCFEYRHLIAELSRTRRVIAFDHLGFGLSERPSAFDYTPEAHTLVLRELVTRLALGRFSLVVHDYGGPIALPIATEEPERIESLVVLNSWMWPLGEDAELARAARFAGSRLGRFLYRWLNASLRLLMPRAYADRRKLTPQIHAQYLAPFRERDARVRVLWTLAKALTRSAPSLSRLWQSRAALSQLPALIVWGSDDELLPPRLLSRLREGLPQAQVHALSGVGHWPQEEAPDHVAALLQGFLPGRTGSAG